MIRFVIGKDYGYKDGKQLVKAKLECDEIDELPAVNFFEGKLLDSGSQCWVIGTGDLYGLTSTGDWVKVNFMGNGEGGDDGSAYAHSLELTIDSQTYVLTATLKNTSGETLGTPQTIDLPLETMVVGGSYDDATKKVILTLKNGNTVDFSVADLVSGLQSEITSTNKLNSDLVDDTNQNNKFVTSAEKTKIANALTEEVVVDKIEEGNMNPITSNAVSNIHKSILTNLKAKTVPGLTLSWGNALYGVSFDKYGYKRAWRYGNICFMYIDMTVKGTYTGSSTWVALWDMPNDLLNDGEKFAMPYSLPICFDSSGRVTAKVLTGCYVDLERGKTYDIKIHGTITLLVYKPD